MSIFIILFIICIFSIICQQLYFSLIELALLREERARATLCCLFPCSCQAARGRGNRETERSEQSQAFSEQQSEADDTDELTDRYIPNGQTGFFPLYAGPESMANESDHFQVQVLEKVWGLNKNVWKMMEHFFSFSVPDYTWMFSVNVDPQPGVLVLLPLSRAEFF